MVIGVTDEPPELVDAWIAANRPSYPVVSLADRAFETFLNVRFFPTAAVIGPDGKLLYSGSASTVQGALAKAMADAEKGGLYGKRLRKVVELMREGELARSYAELRELVERDKLKDDESRRQAGELRTHLEASAADALARARAFEEEGWIYRAFLAIDGIAGADPPFPATPRSSVATRRPRRARQPSPKRSRAASAPRRPRSSSGKVTSSPAFEAWRTIWKRLPGHAHRHGVGTGERRL